MSEEVLQQRGYGATTREMLDLNMRIYTVCVILQKKKNALPQQIVKNVLFCCFSLGCTTVQSIRSLNYGKMGVTVNTIAKQISGSFEVRKCQRMSCTFLNCAERV